MREDPREALLGAIFCSRYLLLLLAMLRIGNLLVRIGGLDKTVSKLLLLLDAANAVATGGGCLLLLLLAAAATAAATGCC